MSRKDIDNDENEIVDPPVVALPLADTIPSKNGNKVRYFSQLQQQHILGAANLIKMFPGSTRYAVSRAEDIKSSFEFFMTPSIENIELQVTILSPWVWGQLKRCVCN